MSEREQTEPVKPNFPERVKLGPNEVVVITGGSGFLGQHIVRCLQERADGIKEIRIVDLVPFKNKLSYKEVYPVEFYKGDIALENHLDAPFSGATCVIHSAAIVQVGHYVNRMDVRSVNIIGTTNVVLKCRQWNISKLVLTSTIDAVFQKDSIFIDQVESQTELPCDEEKFRMGYYGFTKAQAEAVVICGRNKPLANGKYMKTVILRPTVLYGELDPHFIPTALKTAKALGGNLPIPKSLKGGSILQTTYAGNAAWAHVLAVSKLHREIQIEESSGESNLYGGEEWRQADGQELFITDDTHPTSLYEFMKPFLVLKGFSTLKLPIPVTVLLFLIIIMNWFIQHVCPVSFRKWLNVHPQIPTTDAFKMAHSAVHCNRQKSTHCLEYTPIYTESKAKELCARYYLDVPI